MDISNFLLTGSSGFLGSIIKKKLIENGNNIICLNSRKSHANDILADISKPFELPGNMNIDIVVHAAGKAHVVPKTKKEEAEFYNVNYQGTVNLCNSVSSLSQKPKAFIFISTVAVYGADYGEMITEDEALLGSTPYAKSKIMAEQYLHEWSSKNNITLTILRLPLVAGPKPVGNLKSMINGIKTNRYFSIGKANAKKSIVWAEDIAALINNCWHVGGVYNLTDNYDPSLKELETGISQALNKKLPLKIPYFVAKLMALCGDLLGRKTPINSNKLNKLVSTLTFSSANANEKLNWKPTPVLSKLAEIV